MSGRPDVGTQPRDNWDGVDRRAGASVDEVLRGLASSIGSINARLDRGADRMDEIDADLARNTQITNEVRQLLEAGRAGLRVIGWLGQAAKFLGGLATAALAIWGLWSAIRNGTPKP